MGVKKKPTWRLYSGSFFEFIEDKLGGNMELSKIYVSAGLPKSGSSWWYNMCDSCFSRSGGVGRQPFIEKYGLGSMVNANFNMGVLDRENIIFLAQRESVFVKTHSGYCSDANFLEKNNIIKCCFSYRDPRDAALSAFENGVRFRENSYDDGCFSHLITLEMAIDFMAKYCQSVERWITDSEAFLVQYERLLADPSYMLAMFFEFLQIDVSPDVVDDVVKAYSRNKYPRHDGLVKLNVGVAGRYKEIFTDSQLVYANQVMATYLDNWGYSSH